MNCGISNCPHPATTRVRFNHPNPDLRWEENLCDACRREVFQQSSLAPGTGEPSIVGTIPMPPAVTITEGKGFPHAGATTGYPVPWPPY